MFRFTIRDVLWLTVVVALGIGWWLDRTYWKREADTWHSREEIVRRRIWDFGIGYTWPDGEWKP